MPDEGLDWDDVVDVVCVGTTPGVLAYAIFCAAADLDVLIVHPPVETDTALAEFIAAMTDDLDVPTAEGADFDASAVCRVRNRIDADGEEASGRRRTLEPFVGEHLRQWSSLCAASPAGVLFTQVPDSLVPMRTEGGDSIAAAVLGSYSPPLDQWLAEQVADLLPVDDRLAAVIFDDGRIAGVQLADGSLVGATAGLALPVGPAAAEWPTAELDAEVALIGRRAGRFARVELFLR